MEAKDVMSLMCNPFKMSVNQLTFGILQGRRPKRERRVDGQRGQHGARLAAAFAGRRRLGPAVHSLH